jgi:hypothetical protein
MKRLSGGASRRRLQGVVLGFVCAASLLPSAACASHAARDAGVVSIHSFDLYLGDKLGLIDYAMRRTRNVCLAAAGYPQNLRAMSDTPVNPFTDLIVTASSFGPVDEETARRVGLGRDAPAQPPRIVSYDPSYDQNLERCETAAWNKLGKEAQADYHSYFQLGNDLLDFRDQVNRELPPDLIPKILDCLAAKGYSLPDRAAYRHAPDLRMFGVKLGALEGHDDTWQPSRTPGTVQVGPAIPARRYIPTPEESALSVAFFQCRMQNHYVDLAMAASAHVQAEFVKRYESQFIELNPRIEELARKAADMAKAS